MTRAEKSRLSILVVENERLLRHSVIDMLEDIGHEVFGASNADAALKFLDDGPPVDVMLIDIGLPDKDGREVGRQAREAHPGLHIIFATGYGLERMHDTIADLTAEFLPKPYRLEDLERALDSVVYSAEVSG